MICAQTGCLSDPVLLLALRMFSMSDCVNTHPCPRCVLSHQHSQWGLKPLLENYWNLPLAVMVLFTWGLDERWPHDPDQSRTSPWKMRNKGWTVRLMGQMNTQQVCQSCEKLTWKMFLGVFKFTERWIYWFIKSSLNESSRSLTQSPIRTELISKQRLSWNSYHLTSVILCTDWDWTNISTFIKEAGVCFTVVLLMNYF